VSEVFGGSQDLICWTWQCELS